MRNSTVASSWLSGLTPGVPVTVNLSRLNASTVARREREHMIEEEVDVAEEDAPFGSDARTCASSM